MASTFKHDHDVILAPWGEPVVSASCLLHGGSPCPATHGPTRRHYRTAGMQQAVNVMRGAGYRGPIAIPGLTYANDMTRWLAFKPHDPLHQLVAEAHVYGKNACSSTSCFNRTMAPVARRVPLIFGETGETYDASSCAATNISTFLHWADSHGVGYATWTWDTWGNCFALITRLQRRSRQRIRDVRQELPRRPAAAVGPVAVGRSERRDPVQRGDHADGRRSAARRSRSPTGRCRSHVRRLGRRRRRRWRLPRPCSSAAGAESAALRQAAPPRRWPRPTTGRPAAARPRPRAPPARGRRPRGSGRRGPWPSRAGRRRRTRGGRSGRSSSGDGGGASTCASTAGPPRPARERRLSGERLEQQAAERVDVGARVDALAEDLLGRHVLGPRHHGPLPRQGVERLGRLGQPEIAQVGVIAAREQDVRRLDVSVDHPARVSRVERRADLADDPRRAQRARGRHGRRSARAGRSHRRAAS